MLLFLTTNMAAVTSLANQQYMITHFDMMFLVIQFFLPPQTFKFFQNFKAAICEYGVCLRQFQV